MMAVPMRQMRRANSGGLRGLGRIQAIICSCVVVCHCSSPSTSPFFCYELSCRLIFRSFIHVVTQSLCPFVYPAEKPYSPEIDLIYSTATCLIDLADTALSVTRHMSPMARAYVECGALPLSNLLSHAAAHFAVVSIHGSMLTFIGFPPHQSFVSHVQCSVHTFCHLICLHPVPLKVIRLMDLIRLAGRYRLEERIVSGPSCTYGAIASHPLILLTGPGTQMNYISHTTFYQETTSLLNLSELMERFTL